MKKNTNGYINNGKINVGWREWITFPEYNNFKLKAKIDSGARISSLHATHLNEFVKNGEKWIRFRVYQSNSFIYVKRPILRFSIIKNSFGELQKRPLVLMKISLGKNSWETDISLTKRSKMIYPMLIGRNTLKKKHLIHPKRSFVLTEK